MNRTIRRGFTLVELLVVMSIIGLLVGIAVPGLQLARFKAREAALQMKLSTISNALETFKNDQGFYPQSTPSDALLNNVDSDGDFRPDYDSSYLDSGAHKLVQSLIGNDGLGYQEKDIYITDATGQPVDFYGNSTKRTSYIDPEGFQIESMAVDAAQIATNLGLGTSVDTPVWNNKNKVFRDDLTKNSMPILYFKANTRNYIPASINTGGIYSFNDNSDFTAATGMDCVYNITSLDTADVRLNNFAFYVWDGSMDGSVYTFETPKARAAKKESFILMTAGKDGLYGTDDDICNFDYKSSNKLDMINSLN